MRRLKRQGRAPRIELDRQPKMTAGRNFNTERILRRHNRPVHILLGGPIRGQDTGPMGSHLIEVRLGACFGEDNSFGFEYDREWCIKKVLRLWKT